MRQIKNFIPVLLLCTCMIAVVLFCLNAQMEGNLLSYVTFTDTATDRELVPYYDYIHNKYYLFLPAHTSPENVEVSFLRRGYVEFTSGGEFLGSDLKHMIFEQDITLYITYLWYERTACFQFWQCSDLPSLFLEIKNDALEQIHQNKEHSENVVASMVSAEGFPLFSTAATIGGRGNTTWNLPKHPYELKLKEPLEIGNFGAVTKLCLMAEFFDETMLRNALALYGGQQQRIAYCPSYEYANVFVNGQYLGLYGLSDRDAYKNQLGQDEVQGAFLITNKGGSHITLGSRRKADVLYGDSQLILETIAAFEEALNREDWNRCTELIDMESFARKLLLEEFFGNEDMIHASQYFYLDQEGRIHCMVPWDYDLSTGNTSTYFNNRQYYGLLSKHFAFRQNTDWYLKWYGLLLEWPAFRQTLVRILETDYDDGFMEDLEAYLRETNASIDQSRSCDKRKWSYTKVNNNAPAKASGLTDSESYETYFMEYFSKRREVLYDYFRNQEEYCIVEFQDEQFANFCIPKGALLSDYLDGATILNAPSSMSTGFIGWYTLEGLTPAEVDTVTEDIVFYARFGNPEEKKG